MPIRAPVSGASGAGTPEERRALLLRISWSRRFEKSARLRKGKYTPVFRGRILAAAEAAGVPQTQIQQWPARYRRAVLILAACAPLLAVMAVWCAIALRGERLAARSVLDTNPSLNALWSQLLLPAGRTDVVVADSSLSLFHELLDRQLTLSEYLNPSVWARADGLSSNPDLQVFAQRAAQRRFTSLASVTAAYRIAQLAGRDQSRIAFLPNLSKTGNILVISGTEIEGTEGGGEFVTSESSIARLRSLVGSNREARLPYFEVLLKSSRVVGATPGFSIVAFRLLQP